MATCLKEMGTGTQWGSSEDDHDLESGITEEELFSDPKERLRHFYFNLPKSKQLKSRGLARLHENKVNVYVTSSFDSLMELSQKAEVQNQLLQIQAEQRLQQKFNPKILDNKRFEAANFTESRLTLPLNTYLQKTTRSWKDDVTILEENLKTKQVNYHQHRSRTKIIKTPLPLKREADQDLVGDVRKKLQDVQSAVKQKKLSASRIKDIRAEISDFDLIHRPTYYLKLGNEKTNGNEITDILTPSKFKSHHIPDPIMTGCESARAIYNRLPSLISEESLQTVQEERYFPFSKPFVSSPRKRDAHSSDVLFDVEDAIKDLKKMPETKKFQIDLDPKPDLLHSQEEDSMFELNCLRELVDITEGSGWENKK